MSHDSGNQNSRDGFYKTNIPEIVTVLDPDAILDVFYDFAELEAGRDVDLYTSLMHIIDPDTCPEEYLPLLARRLGFKLHGEDTVEAKRRAIKSIVNFYREKGKESSFLSLFRSFGYSIEITPLWTDIDNNLYTEGPLVDDPNDPNPTLFPSSRVDIRFSVISPETISVQPNAISQLVQRMEDVRPIHVLMRSIITGFDFDDVADTPTDTTSGEIVYRPQLYDRFRRPCPLYHFNDFRPPYVRDGTLQHDYNIDPLDFEVVTRGYSGYRGGPVITRGDGVVLDRSGDLSVLRDGSSDNFTTAFGGKPWLHDGLVHGYLYDRSCAAEHDTDLLEATFTSEQVDAIGWKYLHDGSIPDRNRPPGANNPYLRDGAIRVPDDSALATLFFEPDDQFAQAVDVSSRNLSFTHSDPASHRLYRDDPFTANNHGGNFEYNRSGLSAGMRDGSDVDRDPAENARNGIVLHDGTIDRSGGSNVLLRNNQNPFLDASSETGEEFDSLFILEPNADGFTGVGDDFEIIQIPFP